MLDGRFDLSEDPAIHEHISLWNDTIIPVEMYEIDVEGKWSIVDKEIFRSWTGPRRFQGKEIHGPVYNYKSPDDSQPFEGKRLCQCSECQAHVALKFKSN